MANQWDKIAQNNIKKMRKVAVLSTMDRYNDVQTRSPVLTGVFRYNWNFSVNKQNNNFVEKEAMNITGAGDSSLADFLAVMASFKLGDVFYVVNPTPYAMALEHGHSKRQAPFGILRLSVAQWPLVVKRIARKVK